MIIFTTHGVNMSPIDGEGMVPEFMASLNSVPRMGRRSFSPFMRSAIGGTANSSPNNGGFRFINSRPRRRIGPYNPFGGGYPAFRFVGTPNAYQVKLFSVKRGRKWHCTRYLVNNSISYFIKLHEKGALRAKRVKEIAPDEVGNSMRSSKRVLPPVHVGSSMFPSVRQQQSQYWQTLLNEAARESLLQRLVNE